VSGGSAYQLDFRPDYGFGVFDKWIEPLKLHVPNRATHAAVVTALEEDGRTLNVTKLAAQHRLTPQAVGLVRQLSRFGDVAHPIHPFASVHVFEVSGSSVLTSKDMTTFVLATRRSGGCDFWWADHPGDGFGALGVRDEPLSLAEAIAMVGTVVVAQANPTIVDDADRSGYLYSAGLRVSSTLYPALPHWFAWRSRSGRRKQD